MELTSSGKSGSFFYYTADGQYILKTISYSEYKTLYRILPSYFRHIVESKSTLINRYYGLHKLVLMPNENQASQDQVAQKVYFVIMNNIFDSARDIHSIYDLKGSTYKRRVETTSDPSIPRKDQNFLEDGVQLHLKSAEYNHFCDMILTDSNFLRQNDLIDYSLLLGIHDQDKQLDQSSSNLKKSLVSEIDSSRHFFISLLTVLASNFHNVINKASWSAFSADGKYIYTAGIIDILTSFG